MKLTKIVYLHETFHLPKNWGVTHTEKRGRGAKTSESHPQNEVFGLISLNFQHYIKNRNMCDVKYWPALLFQI